MAMTAVRKLIAGVRVRELEGQLENVLDAHAEGGWMARALDAERELVAAGLRQADHWSTDQLDARRRAAKGGES